MPRFVVPRTLPDGLEIPTKPDGLDAARGVASNKAEQAATRVNSHASTGRTKTLWRYDGTDRHAISQAASANGLPVDSIAAGRVLELYSSARSAS